MNKTKNNFKKILIGGLFAVTLLCGGLGFGTMKSETKVASAATTPKYSMQFSWKQTYTYGSGGGTSTTTTSGDNVYSASVKSGQSSTTNISVALYGSSASGTGTLTNGGYIGSTTVNIVVTSGFSSGSVSVTNSSGTSVGSSSSKTLTLTGLSDGMYNASVGFGSAAWVVNSRAGATVSTSGTFSFGVDTKAPVISGATTTANGYTNTSFTVSASDSASGVAAFYYMGPNDSSYKTVSGTSVTIPSDAAFGLYCFYAKDNVGNVSATYYKFLDTKKPTISAYTESGTQITNGYTKAPFHTVVSDVGAGLFMYGYKKSSDTSYNLISVDTVFDESFANNSYDFMAYDGAGNASDVFTICYDTQAPVIFAGTDNTLINPNTSVKGSYIQFTPIDSLSGVKGMYVKKPGTSSYVSYTSGTQYAANGTYYYYAVDNAGNSTPTYYVTLDNTAPYLSCSQTPFYSTTEYDFTVNAADDHSIVALFYKTPLMDDFAVVPNGTSYSVKTTDSDGKYYFYAVDELGNVSETKWIQLSVTAPTATIERNSTNNNYRITWDGTTSKGYLNGSAYSKGRWISQEGDYTFVITNSSNRSTTYTFTIGHSFAPYSVVEPTCVEKGSTIYKCLTCDISYESDYVNAKGHNFTEQLIGETCSEGSYFLYTCTVCGHEEKSDYLTSGGHKYVTTVIAPNCTDRGYTIYTCSVCSYSFRDDYVAARGHGYKKTVVEPTCLEDGYSTYECRVCGYGYTALPTSALGHNYVITVVEPTCTEGGHTFHECSRCKDSFVTDEKAAEGHNFTETSMEVSCEDDGCILHTCTKCSYEYRTNVVKAYGHKYVSEVTRQSTCTEEGNRHFVCARCGKQYDQSIPAFGHSFEIANENNNGGIVSRAYVCDVCGYGYTQELGDQYEEVTNYVEYLFEQYSPYMMYVFIATAGVWSIAMGVAIVVARKNEEKEKAKKMIVNYCIGMVVIFSILVAAPFLIRGIAALIAG